MTIQPFFALVFVLVACSGGSDEPIEDSGESQDTTQDSGETEDTAQGSGETEDTAQHSGETDDAFALSEGVWVGTYSLLENECDAEPSTGDLELVVSNLDGSSFTVALEPFEYSCAIEDLSATCDPLVYDETVGDTLSVFSTANLSFTLESESSMSGLTLIEYSCVGEGCEDVTGQPEGVFCTVDVPFAATLSE